MDTASKITLILSQVAVLLGIIAGPSTADADCRDAGLNTTVHGSFVSNEPLVASLFQLGLHSGTCFGLRALDIVAFRQNLHISERDPSVRQILVSMLKELPGYEMQESSSQVVLVGRFLSIPKDSVFDVLIPEFRCPRSPLNTASNALRMQVAVAIDPSVQGFAGTYSPGDLKDLVGPFNERSKRVWQLLNLLVGQSGGAMWLPSAPESDSPKRKELSPWTTIEYSTSYPEALVTIRELRSRFSTQGVETGSGNDPK
jgi:hypothetical protein